MSSELILPPPSTVERISYAGMAILALVSGCVLAVVVGGLLLESIDPENVGPSDMATIGIMLGFLAVCGWLAWSCRLGALPFRFVADARARKCGYRWGRWWTRQIDLSNAECLRARMWYSSVRPREGNWKWSIHAVMKGATREVKLFSPTTTFTRQSDAEIASRHTLETLAKHLSLPAKFEQTPLAM